MSDVPVPQLDPRTFMRQRAYRGLLVLAAVVGVIVSLASWAFLELMHYAQVWVFEDLPGELGFSGMPAWWPIPVLVLAGLVVAFAVNRLPGRGGHEPSEGLSPGAPTRPVDLPSVLLAAFASIGLGFVLGPEAPLIALGMGLGVLTMHLVRRGSPNQALAVMGAAGSFAAIASIFGSPVIGAILMIEAAGLSGAMLPLILLPGLIASGIGSLVFLGMGSRVGLSTAAYEIKPLSLPAYAHPSLSAFLWSIVLAGLAALAAQLILRLGKTCMHVARKRSFLVVPAAGLAVAVLAIVFLEVTGQSTSLVLFSGQETMGSLVEQAATLSIGTLLLLIALKGLAWGLSLGVGRGGPTFPAIFLGVAAGLLAGHLPGFSQTPAIAVLIGAACVSVLRLPLSSIVIALIVSGAGLGASPLIIVGVVTAYLVTIGLTAGMASSREKAKATESTEAADTVQVRT